MKLVRTPADVLYGPLAVKITSMTSSVESSPFEGGRTDVEMKFKELSKSGKRGDIIFCLSAKFGSLRFNWFIPLFTCYVLHSYS